MSQETLAKIRGNADRIRQMVEKTALLGRGSDPYHEEIYIHIQDNQVNALGSSAGNSAIAFCSFTDSFFDNINADSEDGIEAIINVPDFLTYFDGASDGKLAELRFKGDDPDGFATSLQIESRILTTFMLPVSDSVKEKIPLGVVNRFKEGEKWEGNNVFHSNSGSEPSTEIRTTAEEIQLLIEQTEIFDKEFYPIVTEGESFMLKVGNDGRNESRGTLDGEVEGMDISNNYFHGFNNLFNSISGDVVIRSAPDAPMSVIKEREGSVLRHILAPVK